MTLGQISRHLGDEEFDRLSNAVFGFALATYNSSRDNEGFLKRCLTIAKNSKLWPFFGPGGRSFDLSEKLTEIVSSSFLTSFRTLFRFSLRPIGAETDGGGGVKHPPIGGGKSGVPVGRGLKTLLLKR